MRYDQKTGRVMDKLPAKLGAACDLLYDVDLERKRIGKVAEGLKKSESALKTALLAKFSKDELKGAKGARGQVEAKPSDVPSPKDWDKLYKHIRRTGEFELMQRRLNAGAVEERWDAKKEVPGVERFRVIKVSVTKRKTR